METGVIEEKLRGGNLATPRSPMVDGHQIGFTPSCPGVRQSMRVVAKEMCRLAREQTWSARCRVLCFPSLSLFVPLPLSLDFLYRLVIFGATAPKYEERTLAVPPTRVYANADKHSTQTSVAIIAQYATLRPCFLSL
jgi:hypothetical protein